MDESNNRKMIITYFSRPSLCCFGIMDFDLKFLSTKFNYSLYEVNISQTASSLYHKTQPRNTPIPPCTIQSCKGISKLCYNGTSIPEQPAAPQKTQTQTPQYPPSTPVRSKPIPSHALAKPKNQRTKTEVTM
jgi:hypothetical protein